MASEGSLPNLLKFDVRCFSNYCDGHSMICSKWWKGLIVVFSTSQLPYFKGHMLRSMVIYAQFAFN
jgi:hypothetical protein